MRASRDLLFLFFLVLSWPLHGHVVEQVFGEVKCEGAEWEIEFLFDAGYAKAEWRADPDAPPPTRDWLVGLSREEQDELCEGASAYLKECLSFRDENGRVIEVRHHYVDFDSSPPDFRKLLTGGAYLRVLVSPVEGVEHTDISSVSLPEGSPDFVFKLLVKENEESTYVTLKPGDRFNLHEKQLPASLHALKEGFIHVLPLGFDHLLFILALFLLSRSWKPLLFQSLLFTVAHTLTLGLTASGVIAPRSEIIEALVALSIVALAVENLFVKKVSRSRVALVFVFGLVHGMAFASALSTLIAPGEGFLVRLIFANLGVELAQVVILAVAWVVTMKWDETSRYKKFRVAANAVLALIAVYFFVERVV